MRRALNNLKVIAGYKNGQIARQRTDVRINVDRPVGGVHGKNLEIAKNID